jgi:hypothetical protein
MEVRPAGMVIEFRIRSRHAKCFRAALTEPFGQVAHDIARTDTPRRNSPRYGIDAAPKTNSLVLTL